MTDKNGEIKKGDEEGRTQSRWRKKEGMREMINNNEDTIKKNCNDRLEWLNVRRRIKKKEG